MLPALDEALTRLETIDPEQARIVELRYSPASASKRRPTRWACRRRR